MHLGMSTGMPSEPLERLGESSALGRSIARFVHLLILVTAKPKR